MSEAIDPEFAEIFVEECGEAFETITQCLLKLEDDPADVDTLSRAFRAIHTFKGSSGMLGLSRLTALAHEVETRFDRYRSGRERLTPEAVTLTLRCVDFFADFVNRLDNDLDADEGDPSGLIAELNAIPASAVQTKDGSDRASEDVDPAAAIADATPEGDRDDDEVKAGTGEAGTVGSEAATDDYRIVVTFEADVEMADLKAQLIERRLSEWAEVREASGPGLEREDSADRAVFRVRPYDGSDPRSDDSRLNSLAVDGVSGIRVESNDEPEAAPEAETHAESTAASGVNEDLDAVVDAPPAAETPPPPETPTGSAEPEPIEPVSPTSSQESGTEAAPPVQTAKSSGSVRVGIERLDSLMNLAGELTVAGSRFDQLRDDLVGLMRTEPVVEATPGGPAVDPVIRQWVGRLSEGVDQLGRLSRGIQHGVLETRMVPIGPTLTRCRRVVRDVSREIGKSVELRLIGEDTELDKRMVDALYDPLLHLIRNALDHGIEDAQTRRDVGKPATGRVTIAAAHEGNQILISVRDDGGGLNRDAIADRAVDRGLISADRATKSSDGEIYDLIFRPGFSTAEKTTSVSGRGVGMDVVRSSVGSLGGTIQIDSVFGRGSTFTLRLPLTLAIVNAIVVRCRSIPLAIPTSAVNEIISLSDDEVRPAASPGGGDQPMVRLRDRYLPVHDLFDLYRWNHPGGHGKLPLPKSPPAEDPRPGVVLRINNTPTALAIDSIDGNRDVVIKTLDASLRELRGVSGACVLGDGSVALVVDTTGLSELILARAVRQG